MDDCDDLTCLERVYAHTIQLLQKQSISVLPDLSTLKASRSSLLQRLPEHGGLGLEKTTDHLLRDIAPALNGSSLSPKYYGFVTGGVTPAARVADVLVSTYDQNPQMHLPDQTIASNVEDRALRLLMEVLRFEPSAWSGVFSTGATASNILGLACGREHLLNNRLKDRLGSNTKETIGSLGLLRGCRLAEVDEIHIYTTLAHSSLYKASSILGLGHSCIKHVGKSDNDLGLDMTKLEQQLELDWQNKVSIVVISCGEVNTGLFATHGYDELKALRRVCDKYGAWLHVDGGRLPIIVLLIVIVLVLIIHPISSIWNFCTSP